MAIGELGQFNTSPNGPLDLSQYISGVTEQANKNWKNQQDQMQFAKDQFAKTSGTTDKVVDRALDTSGRFAGYSAADRDMYDKQYVPAMQEQLDFARNYNTPGRAAANREAAIGQSNLSFDATGDSLRRGLQSYGVDPSAGRYAGLDAGLATKRAMSAASAGTQSDRQTEMLGQQYLANAIKTGQVLPGQAATEANVGMAAGNQAVNAGLAQGTAGMSWMGTPLQWNQQGNAMYNQWPGAANLQYQAGRQSNQDTFNDNLAMMKFDQSSSTGTGAALGMGAGALGGILGGGSGGGGGLGSILGGAFGGGGGNSGVLDTGLGNSAANAAANSVGGVMAARGGRIRRYDKGGRVSDVNDMNDFPPYEGLHNRPYKEEDEIMKDDLLNARGQMAKDFRRREEEGREKSVYFGNIDRQPRDRPNPVQQYARGGDVGGDPELGLTPGEHAVYQSLWGKYADGGSVPGASRTDQINVGVGNLGREPWDRSGGADDPSGRGGTQPFGSDVGRQQWGDTGGASNTGGGGGGGGGSSAMNTIGNVVGMAAKVLPFFLDRGGSVPGYIGGGDVGGMGFSPMGYISDAVNIGTEIGGGDQGETDSPQTPMDPLSNVWDTAYGVPREKYDEGERIGSSVGRPIGRAIGDYFTGGVGSGAFAEGFGRAGGAVGAGVQGHFGEAANDILQGTPLSFIKFQEGGPTPEVGAQGGDGGSNMVPPGASPSGGEQTDDVPAMVSVDEFVFPKDVAKWFGEKYLQNMIEKARREMSAAQAQPEPTNIPQAIAMQPPSFRSEGARA